MSGSRSVVSGVGRLGKRERSSSSAIRGSTANPDRTIGKPGNTRAAAASSEGSEHRHVANPSTRSFAGRELVRGRGPLARRLRSIPALRK